LLLPASALPCVWTISWVGYINLKNKLTASGSWYLSVKIITVCDLHSPIAVQIEVI
jgi:hypothetical protein